MGKRIVLTEYPNLENYPKVETMLDSESMCGYTQRTTFWDDFTIAERFGVKAIEDIYIEMLSTHGRLMLCSLQSWY